MSRFFSSISSMFTNVQTLVENAMEKYIVRVSGQTTIDGFIFDVVDEESLTLSSDITDHYVEENYAVQDHIAHRPERIVIRGYVGEIRDLFPRVAVSGVTAIQSLSSIGGYAPQFAEQATRKYAQIAGTVSRVGEYINQAQNVYDIISGKLTTADRQQRAYATFYTLWKSRKLVDIECPYGVFNNMAIEHVKITQEGDNRYTSDISVTLKKIRQVEEAVPVTRAMFGRISANLADVSKMGQSAGTTVDRTGAPLTIGSLRTAFRSGL